MEAEELTRKRGFIMAEMLDEVRKMAEDTRRISGPETLRRMRELLRYLQIQFGLYDKLKED